MYQENLEHELDQLFAALRKTDQPEEIKDIEEKIWDIWMQNNSHQVNVLMEQGCDALAESDYTQAIQFFTQITEIEPQYAEGWNKRATAYYLRGNYKHSIRDIRATLSLEGRHFGALSGLGSIYLTIGDFKAALKVYQKLAKIYPQDADFKRQIEVLQEQINP